MTSSDFYPKLLNPEPIIALFTSDDPMQCIWSERDWPGLWRHQLRASLLSELRAIDPTWGLGIDTLCSRQNPPIATFGELFASDTPPLAALDLVKQYAKHHLDEVRYELPRSIASAVYLMALLSAIARCGKNISSMDESKIREQGRQMLALGWLDAETKLRIQSMLA